MRIGIVTSLLWSRWGPFWSDLLREAGQEVVVADAEALVAPAEDALDSVVPGLAFEVVVAEALALAHCDRLLVPDLNPGLAGGDEGGRGGGQDPWIAALPATLARAVPGIPPVESVPATLETDPESRALELLLPILRDPIAVKRAWGRVRSRAVPPRAPGVRWQLRPSELRTVGIVGQPWLVTDAVVDALRARSDRDDEHYVSMHRLSPTDLRAEGRRMDATLIDTDAEAVGAARLFGRRGAVTEIRFVRDRRSGSDAWLQRRVEAATRKHVEAVDLDGLAPSDGSDEAGDPLAAAFRLLAPQ